MSASSSSRASSKSSRTGRSSAQRITLLQRAAAFSARAHAGQLRKDGLTPYAAHPVRVMLTLREVFGHDDAAALAAALLHDTIEDTTTDYDDLIEHFGAEVADLVVAVTKNSMLPEAQREREYDERLAKADWRARLIKLADVYDNFSDQPEGASRRKILTKVKRAVALAKADANEHVETSWALAAIEQLTGVR